MIVCLCRGLSERDLRGVIADGAHSTEALSASCGAGADCGACLSTLDRLVEAACARRAGLLPAAALVPVGA